VHDAIQMEANAFANEDWEAVAEAHHKLEELNGYDATARAGRLLHGLGFPAETHSRRCRISPAAGACASTSRAR
jgi:ATP-binding cassette subfamily F protein 3